MSSRPFPHLRFVVAFVLALAGAHGLAQSLAPPEFDVTLIDGESSSRTFGVFTAMLDVTAAGSRDSVDGDLPAADGQAVTDFVGITGGFYIGRLVSAGHADTFRLSLPSFDAIPAATLTPVENAFFNATDAPDCAVSATPDDVLVTSIALSIGFGSPGFIAVGFDGAQPTIVVERPLPDPSGFPEEGATLLSWTYAEAPVVVDFTGSDCNGFVVESVALEPGWNTLAWTFTNVVGRPPTATLDVVDAPDAIWLYTNWR